MSNSRRTKIGFLALAFQKNLLSTFIIILGATQISAQTSESLKLWYKQPAANWNEALPVGNGRLGAMVFGGIQQERIQLNEETIWTKDGEYKDQPNAHKYLKEIRKTAF